MGRLLMDQGKLSADDVDRVLRMQGDHPIRFGEAARQLALVNEADVEQALARQFHHAYIRAEDNPYPAELVAAQHGTSAQMENLRGLRSRLMLQWFGKGNKELVIAAVNSGDGTSLLTANLAIAFSQLGQRTLLVDANLRQPRQAAIFDIPARSGLSDMLAERAGPEAIVRSRDFPSLSILPAGTCPPNPQELLGRASFATLRTGLAGHFDVMLYDAPSFSSSADALGMAANVSGVLVLARKHTSARAEIEAILQQLHQCGTAAVGAVLNAY